MLRAMIRGRADRRCCAAAALAAQRPILPRPPAPDLVLFNGKVITVDRGFTDSRGRRDHRRSHHGRRQRRSDADRRRAGDADDRSQGPRGDSGADGQPSPRRRRRSRRRSVARAIDGRRRWRRCSARVAGIEARRRDRLQQRLARGAAQGTAAAAARRSRHASRRRIPSSSCAAATNTSSIPRRWRDGTSPRTRPSRPAAASRRYADGRLNGELVDTAKALVRLPPPPPRTPQQQLDDRIADYKKLNEAGLTGDSPSRHFDRRLSNAAGDAEARPADDPHQRAAAAGDRTDGGRAADRRRRASSRTRATSGCASAASSSPSTAASKAA